MSNCFGSIDCNDITLNTINFQGNSVDLSSNISGNQLLNLSTSGSGVIALNFKRNGVLKSDMFVDVDDTTVINNTDNNTRIAIGTGTVNIGTILGAQKLNVGGTVNISGGGVLYDTGSSIYKMYSNMNIGTVSLGNVSFSLPTSISYDKVVGVQCFAYNASNQVEMITTATIQVLNHALNISNATSYNGKVVGCYINFIM